MFGKAHGERGMDGGRLKLNWLSKLLPALADDANEDGLIRYTHSYMVQIISGILFTDHQGSREICKAKKGAEEIVGCVLLLQLWAWTRLLTLAIVPRGPYVDNWRLDPKLNILQRFLNPTTNRFEVALMYDDDDVEFMFEAVDSSFRKNYVELYVEKIFEWEFNRKQLIYDDIPYYKSFDRSSTVASFNEPIMQKPRDILVPTELEKRMIFESKEEMMCVIKDVHLRNHQEIKVPRSYSESWEVACKRKTEGCAWMLRA
ncbi:hypothetical protein POM88_045899 [Heracleum sosnowskyi]|uniref:Aminotransferase-like plant mobile domain-containing protein n=1 Tax=Heracleum sosnowskyi TaxID=360622 RepID=A0AAD8M478_9APIA|nr:hypothetical protein POM88_045899 [Heracleum sosnowskyi]